MRLCTGCHHCHKQRKMFESALVSWEGEGKGKQRDFTAGAGGREHYKSNDFMSGQHSSTQRCHAWEMMIWKATLVEIKQWSTTTTTTNGILLIKEAQWMHEDNGIISLDMPGSFNKKGINSLSKLLCLNLQQW